MKFPKTHHFFKLAFNLCFILLALSCNPAKRVIESGEASEKLSAKQVIREHQRADSEFKTLQSKVKIDIIQNDGEHGATFTMRFEKDKTIWLSAPLGLARMMITPNRVKFYNKTDNTFFDGDYALLSDVAGIELDFLKVQNILLGQAIYNLKSEPHLVSVVENSYALQPEDQKALLELFYLINPSHFKMDSLQLQQQAEKRFLQVDYSSYQNVEKRILPQKIQIIAVEDSDQVIINLEFRSTTLNGELRFPFKIPSGYKEIEIK